MGKLWVFAKDMLTTSKTPLDTFRQTQGENRAKRHGLSRHGYCLSEQWKVQPATCLSKVATGFGYLLFVKPAQLADSGYKLVIP